MGGFSATVRRLLGSAIQSEFFPRKSLLVLEDSGGGPARTPARSAHHAGGRPGSECAARHERSNERGRGAARSPDTEREWHPTSVLPPSKASSSTNARDRLHCRVFSAKL